MDYNYSIIIPHKNIPELLQRCLDSIPKRDDVQIIIVDDNSDPGIVDFDHFPGLGCTNTEVYFDKTGGGAGRARNVGLEHAKGKWLLFFDADDFAKSNLNTIMDENVNSEADVIYFRPTAVMSDDYEIKSNRDNDLIAHYANFKISGNDTLFRTNCYPVWSKFISSALVKEKHILFDEIIYSNDCYFSTAIGCYAKRIEVKDDGYYVVTERKNSLISNYLQKPGELECRATAFLHASQVIVNSHYSIDEASVMYYARLLYKKNNLLFAQYLHLGKLCGYSHIALYRLIFKGTVSKWERLYKYAKSLLLEIATIPMFRK